MRNRLQNLALLTVTLILGVLLLEGASGFLLTKPELEPKKKGLERILADAKLPSELNHFGGAATSPHPYMLVQNTPNYVKESKRQHNSLGYRSEDVSLKKDPNVFRILALGGSTTYGWLIPDYRNVWPHLLQVLLKSKFESKGLRVEVINAGLPYATSAELLSSWIFRHQFLEPDLVIIHTGGNDVAPLLFPDYDPEYTHFRARGLTYKIPKAKYIRPILRRSNVLTLAALLFVPQNPLDSVYISQPYPFSSLKFDEVKHRIEHTYPLGFERNLTSLVRAAKDAGSLVALISFVQGSEQQIRKGRVDMAGLEKAFVWGLEKNQVIMRSVSESEKVPYFQPEQSQFPDELFVDNSHLNEKGQAVKAKYIANFLGRSGVL